MFDDREGRPIPLEGFHGAPAQLFLGRGDSPLEVIIAQVDSCPGAGQLRNAWKARKGGRVAPVIVVVQHPSGYTLCTSRASDPEAFLELPGDDVKRLCLAALDSPNRHAVYRIFASVLPYIDTPTPGLRNEGLFAIHELRTGVPRRSDWEESCRLALPLIHKRGRDLILAMGFEIRPTAGAASILATETGAQVAAAAFLEELESAEASSQRFGGLSPIQYVLAKADETQVDYVVITSGAAIRLYMSAPGAGVGHRSRTETCTELRLDFLRPQHAGYLWLLFSPRAFSAGGFVEQILFSSHRYAADLGVRLRDRIHSDVVPRLAEAVLQARRRKQTPEEVKLAYQSALRVLFRLLFIAYAEDLDLLPFKTNEAYKGRAVKTKARELLEARSKGASGEVPWQEIMVLFRAIDRGRADWGIPAYDGGLFSNEPEESDVGGLLAELALPDGLFTRAFERLLIEETEEGRGAVDFRSLGVRAFGTIYEGLLENDLSIAEEDLSLDEEGRYAPSRRGEEPCVHKGEAYLVTASGERKATGTYFTKSFAVEHLLDQALEPALKRHLGLLDSLPEEEAGDSFFDFKVADIAMGSGHFLVAAIDRIERRLSDYLVKRRLAAVTGEIDRLRGRAREALGPLSDAVEIEEAQLLRRQIARRCIYGVDLNREAVELARLSVWIHTFVPGLPLSVLDHNIVQGDSLVGIGTIEESFELVRKMGLPLFRDPIEALLKKASEAVSQLARLSDADAAEIRKAREKLGEFSKTVEPARALFDIFTATRLDPSLEEAIMSALGMWEKRRDELPGSRYHKQALEAISPLEAFHFPLAFPEVFMRTRAGFDVILGNPPWEEAMIEEDDFWTRWEPGYQGRPQHERERLRKTYRKEHPERVARFEKEQNHADALRHVLLNLYPGMSKGDPDTYKAFCWRFWNLCARPGGKIGVVLPRTAFMSKGSEEWRKEIISNGNMNDLTFLLNSGGWVFDAAEPRYTIALMSLEPASPDSVKECPQTIPIRGPFSSYERFKAGVAHEPYLLQKDFVLKGTDTAALPLLPAEGSLDIVIQMRKAPRIDLDNGKGWRARPYTELHATNEKDVMHFSEDPPEGHWPVFKGASFDIWESDTGTYYAWVKPEKILRYLQKKRLQAGRRQGSPFAEFDEKWLEDQRTLPCLHPRIAFRDVTNRTNRRTVIAALIPPEVAITNKGPYFLWPRGDEKDQAFLLGVFCSIPLDWYARRFVETNVNFHILNALPIPRPPRDDEIWQRVVALAGRLASQDRRLRSWAKKVGVDCGALDEEAMGDMVAELDAAVACLYGLTGEHLCHIFETFHEGWEYKEDLEQTLKHFAKLKSK